MPSKQPSNEFNDEYVEIFNIGIFLKKLGTLVIEIADASYRILNIN